MQSLLPILPYIQIVLAILLAAGVLMQQSSAALGSAFGGGDNWGGGFHTRRGAERFLFKGTIIVASLFIAVSLVAFFGSR